MRQRRGNFVSAPLAAGANNAIVPHNPKRRYLLLSNTGSAGAFVAMNADTITVQNGHRIGTAQNVMEFRSEDCGDMTQGPVSIFNTGAANSSFAYIEGLDDADL